MWLEILRKILCSQEKLDDARAMIVFLEERIDTLVQERDAFYELPLISPNPDRDVLDGKYTGDLTIEDVIDQFEYRAGIHLTYIELNKTDPAYKAYGTTRYHNWAINGYVKAMEYLRILSGE